MARNALTRRRRRRGAGIVAVVLLLLVGGAAAYWGPGLFREQGYRLSTERCTAELPDFTDNKTAEQANNAAIIAAVGMSHGFGVQGVTVGIATAIQESSLRNLDYGDRDSLGLFQQRPSQGWGTEEQIMDPHYSASMFFLALDRVEGWEDMSLTDAAQAVQISGFPDAYADHEQEALAWATAFTGGNAVVDCSVSAANAGSAQAVSERIAWDFGSGRYTVEILEETEDSTVLGVTAIDNTDAALFALREWAAATASTTGIQEATIGGNGWNNQLGRIEAQDDDQGDEQPFLGVRLVLNSP
jgi:hypothetical protein